MHYAVSEGDRGGDAYPGHSAWKSAAEHTYDVANRLAGGQAKAALFRSAALLDRVGTQDETGAGVEGAWYGNDTVWRMSLDLQRLLRYGRADGTLDETPQRPIVSVTDAIVAGQGEGPLSPTPCALGLVTVACAAAPRQRDSQTAALTLATRVEGDSHTRSGARVALGKPP